MQENNRKRTSSETMSDNPDQETESYQSFVDEPVEKRPRKFNIISSNVAAALERTGTSNRNASIIFKALIQDKHMRMEEESNYSISHRTIRLTRQSRVKEMAEEVSFYRRIALIFLITITITIVQNKLSIHITLCPSSTVDLVLCR